MAQLPAGFELDPTQAAMAEAWKNRSKILKGFQEAWRRVTDGQLVVALFGIGGVGKTTASHLLASGVEKASSNFDYFPTSASDPKLLKNKYFSYVWDTAGQDEFRNSSWIEAFGALEGSGRCVIINMTCYGYSALAQESFDDLKRITGRKSTREVFEEYIRIERRKELGLLADLQKELRRVKARKSIITVINKQDLWWSQKVAVNRHYTRGAFAKRLESIRSEHPDGNVNLAFRPVSLCPLNLKTADGKVVAETCSGYDAALREFHLSQLIKLLGEQIR